MRQSGNDNSATILMETHLGSIQPTKRAKEISRLIGLYDARLASIEEERAQCGEFGDLNVHETEVVKLTDEEYRKAAQAKMKEELKVLYRENHLDHAENKNRK